MATVPQPVNPEINNTEPAAPTTPPFSPKNFLGRALPLIGLGYRVTPLKPDSKQPILPNWQNTASRDETQIGKWAVQYPDANVGIVQSSTAEAGTWGIDIDDMTWFTKPQTVLIDLIRGVTKDADVPHQVPCEAEVWTGSGKCHYHFLHDDYSRANLKNHAEQNPKRAAGPPKDADESAIEHWARTTSENLFEVKYHGTQLVAPGSIHPNGKPYKWFESTHPITRVCDGTPQVAPRCLVDWLAARIRSKSGPGSGGSGSCSTISVSSRKSLRLKEGIDFGASLTAAGLEFDTRDDSSGIDYDYHGINGQGCLVKGGIHSDHSSNPRQCSFKVNGREIFHSCFSAGCQSPGQTRKALKSLDLEHVLEAPVLVPYFPYSDEGNAERLVLAHGENLRYVHNERQWRIWDGKRWAADLTGEIDRIAIATVRNMSKEAASITDDDRRRGRMKWALSSENRARRQNMIECARHQREVAANTEHFDANPMLLNVLNGTIDLKTGELWPHQRENLLSKQAPVELRPDAECPLWRGFLDEIFMGDTETISFIQRAVGYSLTGDISEQCLFLLIGDGNNGKGVFLKTLSSMMGDYTASANFDTFTAHKNEHSGPRDGVADLVGARFVRASESEEGKRLSEAKLKGLVAPDGKIRACRLYQESFEFYPQHKIWLATNHEPAIRGTDDGIWRRIRRVPFNYFVRPEKRVPDLEEKLKPELSGILNWALEGLRDWRDSGLGTSLSVLRATADYRASQNRTKRFFDECIVSAKPEEYALSEEVYGAFKIWCEKNGEYYPTQTKFGMEFGKLAIPGKARDGRRAYFGIQLRNHPRRIEGF